MSSILTRARVEMGNWATSNATGSIFCYGWVTLRRIGFVYRGDPGAQNLRKSPLP